MKRLFIAIRIPSDEKFTTACRAIRRSSTKLDKINWIDLENIHMTLKFLGDTKEDVIPAIEQKIEELTKPMASFDICLNRIGAFGSRYQPRIIWVGSDDKIKEINQLHKGLEKHMRAFGLNLLSVILFLMPPWPAFTASTIRNIFGNKSLPTLLYLTIA